MGARTIVCLILIVIAVVYVFKRWNRSESIKFLPMLCIGLLLVPLSFYEIKWLVLEKQASNAVVTLTGNPEAYAHCQRFTSALLDTSNLSGHVMYSKPNEAFIDYETCKALFSWMNSDKKNPTESQIVAVHVLTHEAMHVAGDFSEPSAECKAIQKDVITVRELHGDTLMGRSLAKTYYDQLYPRMDINYRSADCSPGGLMDLSPDDGEFP